MRTLYGYFRSSAAYRVRIALNLKQLECEHKAVNLIPGVSEQKSDAYRAINPQQGAVFH
nr:glutathione S-transferase N-terminal domain-containing protein [Kordiimonas gwangyangensis]